MDAQDEQDKKAQRRQFGIGEKERDQDQDHDQDHDLWGCKLAHLLSRSNDSNIWLLRQRRYTPEPSVALCRAKPLDLRSVAKHGLGKAW